MTSRRSRLKAVANLPTRRKTLTSQKNEDEITSIEVSTEKNDLFNEKSDIVESNAINKHVEQSLSDVQSENIGNELILQNVDVDVNNAEESDQTLVINKSNDSENVDNNISCMLIMCKADNRNDGAHRSYKRFKPNLVLSTERKKQQPVENIPETEGLEVGNPTDIEVYNNPINSCNNVNNNNNIIKDGLKSYAVLTSHNVLENPTQDCTLTPLTPCENAFIDTTLENLTTQDYQEVEIFTEAEQTEIFSNEVNENCNSVIETQVLEPVLTNFTAQDQHYKVIGNYTIHKTPSENINKKTLVRNKNFNVKTNINGKSIDLQNKDVHVLEDVRSFNIQNIASDNRQNKITTYKRKRSRCNDFTKKLADAKREFQKKYEKTKPDRSTLKMIDLIFYNPSTNPMESKTKNDQNDLSGTQSELIQDLLNEEKVDEPESSDSILTNSLASDNSESEVLNKMPVPQVKIGLDGEIILDEKSLVIETTDARRGREELQNSVPVFEDRGSKVSYYRGKNKKTRDWADFETKRFYKALNTIGPDFSLMQKYFPKRSRLELKNKFKREERLNRSLIDKALNNPSEFDMTQLEKDLAREKEAEEEEIEMRLCKVVKNTVKKPRVKTSLLSREINETDVVDVENTQMSKKLLESEKNKKAKEFDFVLQKLLSTESEMRSREIPEICSQSNSSFQSSDHDVT